MQFLVKCDGKSTGSVSVCCCLFSDTQMGIVSELLEKCENTYYL
ncbi:hypothetical protein X975_26651, partial [Stegodyphus mimosarum]